MMIVMVKVMLRRTNRWRLSSGIARNCRARNSAPDAKTSACGQHTSASRTSIGGFVCCFSGCGQVLGSGAA
jgi:hypothetical protein